MSSIGVVVFRNAPLARTQVLQESMNNSLNISNNESDKNCRQEIIIVRKKQRIQSPATIPVTSLVRAVENVNNSVAAKRPRVRDDVPEEAVKSPTPLAVARRNARERNRVRQVNDGFAALRRHIPEEVASAFENANSNRGPNKKLSKVETLRMAVEYIRNLETLLDITDKENSSRPSIDSFPSPASSSPRDNSQERSYYSLHSPTLEDDDMDEDDLDGSMCHLAQQHQYLSLPSSEQFQLVSTPHLYEEDEGQPLTPGSDLLAPEEVNSHTFDENFQFPNSAEQFTVIPEQSYCSESDIAVNESDFEVKYAESLQPQSYTSELSYEVVNPDLILAQDQYKFKEEEDNYIENQQYNDVELKRELPEIQVTPEDREQFEETLKWWQEKTRQGRPSLKSAKN